MRYIVFIIIPLLFMVGCDSCNLPAQNDPLNLKGICTPNPYDQNVTSYGFYLWQGDDTLQANLAFNQNVTSWGDSVVANFTAVHNWIQIGYTATNANGISSMATSRFYSYFEFNEPSTPQGVEVVQ